MTPYVFEPLGYDESWTPRLIAASVENYDVVIQVLKGERYEIFSRVNEGLYDNSMPDKDTTEISTLSPSNIARKLIL